MYNASIYPKKTLKISKHNRRAVSPVVATLVLIVIAIVGAVGVGLILSNVSTNVGKQANPGNAGQGAQSTLLIGGSTTVFPITEAARPAFQSQYHVTILDAQGGSDAGMQGVLSGALDIGAASSVGAVTNLENAVQANNLQASVTVNPTLIGGSAVVVIENAAGNATAAGFLTDGTFSCVGITKAALKQIFSQATFGVTAGACTSANHNTLDAAGVGAGALIPVSRSDNSGTQDQFAGYVGLPKQSAGGNFIGTTAQGNAGVLNYVNTHPGSIGFVDLGFAEGAASGSLCPAGTGGTTAKLCGVAMPQVMTSAPTQQPINGTSTTLSSGVAFSGGTTYDGYVALNHKASNVHNAIIASLKAAYFANPLTGAGSKSLFPDSSGSGTGLARTFYYVTNGAPTPLEQQWLTYITNFNQEYAFANNGYFSQYDITSA